MSSLHQKSPAHGVNRPLSPPAALTRRFFTMTTDATIFSNMLFDWRLENPGFAGTVIQEFDPVTRQLVGARRHFYRGTSLGVCEGPQILKK